MSCQRFEGMSPVCSHLIGSFASVLLINVTEMSCKNRLCPSLLKCSKRCSCKQASPLAFFLSLHLWLFERYLEQSVVLPTYCLRQVLHVKRYIKHLSLQSKLWLILYDVWVTVLVNASVSGTLWHTSETCYIAFTRSCLPFHWINLSPN